MLAVGTLTSNISFTSLVWRLAAQQQPRLWNNSMLSGFNPSPRQAESYKAEKCKEAAESRRKLTQYVYQVRSGYTTRFQEQSLLGPEQTRLAVNSRGGATYLSVPSRTWRSN